jgi:hypothetical protein
MNAISVGPIFNTGAAPRRRGVLEPNCCSRGRSIASRRPSRLWVRAESDTRLEKLMLLALAIGAVIGIAYGFSCLVDLVQNWAVFERGISTLI